MEVVSQQLLLSALLAVENILFCLALGKSYSPSQHLPNLVHKDYYFIRNIIYYYPSAYCPTLQGSQNPIIDIF